MRAYPYCRVCHGGDSIGEDVVIQILKSKHAVFEKEKAFPDLKSKHGNPLRFDFYITTRKRSFIIEIDGQQHDGKQHDGFDGNARENDIIKNAYCLSHNIRLYRIPYAGYAKTVEWLVLGVLHNEGYPEGRRRCDDKRAQSMIVTSPTDCAFHVEKKADA
jgi:hypothetical protein